MTEVARVVDGNADLRGEAERLLAEIRQLKREVRARRRGFTPRRATAHSTQSLFC